MRPRRPPWDRVSGGYVMGNTRVAFGLAVVGAILLSGCSAPAPEPAEADEIEATPASYPIPDGCPTGDDFGVAYVDQEGWAEEIDAVLLDTAVSSPLPSGGCGYIAGTGGSTDDGVAYERIIVMYFNIDTPERPTHSELIDWGITTGGNSEVDETYDEPEVTGVALPQEFSTFTNASLSWVDGETSFRFQEDTDIPEFTQGASATIEFYLATEVIDSLKAAASAGIDPTDPTTALAAGLPLTSSVTFGAVDPDGYSVEYNVTGTLTPFVSDVTNSAPGELEVFATGSLTGNVKNTTPERNAKSASVGAFLVYPTGSAVCNDFNGLSVTGADWSDSSYCSIGVSGMPGLELAPDSVQPFDGTKSELRFGQHPEGGTALIDYNAPIAMYASIDPIRMLTRTDWTSDVGCLTKQRTTAMWVVPMAGWPDPICQP